MSDNKPDAHTESQPFRNATPNDANNNAEIKQAFKDSNAEKSRALHQKKIELARKRKERQPIYEEATNPNKSNSKIKVNNEDNDSNNLLKNGNNNNNNNNNDNITNDTIEEKGIDIEMGAEIHKNLGDYVKSIIYGGLDGIITTFAVVAGVQGASLKTEVILVLGFANLVADGLSMGVGDFLSEKAEIDFARSERKREKWEFDNFKEGEIQEMIEIYESKGIKKTDAELILRTMSKYPDFFIDHMMIQELDINPPDNDANPMMNGFVTLCSFMIFGCVPLLAYLIFESVDFGKGYDPKFLISIILTIITLGVLGGIKGKMTESNIIKSALFVMCNGAAAAGASYLIGWCLGELTGVSA